MGTKRKMEIHLPILYNGAQYVFCGTFPFPLLSVSPTTGSAYRTKPGSFLVLLKLAVVQNRFKGQQKQSIYLRGQFYVLKRQGFVSGSLTTSKHCDI